MNHTEASIVRAVRSRGSDAADLRDAAHEACHALECGALRWGREPLHDALVVYGRSTVIGRAFLWRSEMLARAVEQIVCDGMGEPIEPIENRLVTAHLEAMSFRYPFPRLKESYKFVVSLSTSDEAIQLADRVTSLEPIK